MEIMIDTKRKNGAMKLTNLRRMEDLEQTITDIPELSKPLSIVNIAKSFNQAYYNGNPDFYTLPSPNEEMFLLPYIKNSLKNSKDNQLKSYISSDGSVARMTTFIKDENGERMEAIEAHIRNKVDKLFPSERYEVIITGKPSVFQ
jgi:predicted RND superfamily exporter protein